MKKIQKKLQASKDYEFININEPHKLNQGSFTLIKKTMKSKGVYFNLSKHQKKIYSNFLKFIKKFNN
jgi:hypothetical protein